MLVGNVQLLERLLAGLEKVAADRLLNLGGVLIHSIPYPIQETHGADLGCAREPKLNHQIEPRKRNTAFAEEDTLVGLEVEESRRSSGAGQEEAAHVRCTRESHEEGTCGEWGGGDESWLVSWAFLTTSKHSFGPMQ